MAGPALIEPRPLLYGPRGQPISLSHGVGGQEGRTFKFDWARRPFHADVVADIERTWPGVRIVWVAGVTIRLLEPRTSILRHSWLPIERWRLGEPHKAGHPRGWLIRDNPYGTPYDFFYTVENDDGTYRDVDARLVAALDRMHAKNRAAVAHDNLVRRERLMRQKREEFRASLRERMPALRSMAFDMGRTGMTREDWRPEVERKIEKAEKWHERVAAEVPA